ncbi:LPS export ABC transporter permease LptF [Pseudomonas putida]|uniref:LPS export ABC transporter permease LptF n=1 Tax=Pseudomonas putida TaxID=303 RepID=UPI00390658CE
MFKIERYIIAEISRPVGLMIGFLTFVFASYSAERYLSEAANGTLPVNAVLQIVFYKVVIALEMLLPVGLYTSVAIALGRLYHDSEIAAMLASGVSPLRFYRAVLFIASPLALAVALLSLHGRPWAYAQTYALEQQAQSALDVTHLQAQRFNVSQDNGRMILAQDIDVGSRQLGEALIYEPDQDKSRVFRARVATVSDPDPTSPAFILQHGSTYTLQHHTAKDTELRFQQLRLQLKPLEQNADAKRKASPSEVLATSAETDDQAELQWRKSRGLCALLLALLAVPLSRTAPRQGRFSTLLPVALVFIAVFYGGNLCRSMVANAIVPLTPGVWLLPLTMLLGVAGLIARDLRLLAKWFR